MIWFRRIVSLVAALLLTIQLRAQVLQSSTLTGEVVAYRANRIGDYDGLQLRMATGNALLHFPPHMAAAIQKVAPLRQRVEVIAAPPTPHHLSTNTLADYQLLLVKNLTTGRLIRLVDVPPPPPQRGRLVTTEGTLNGTLTDDHGQLIALLVGPYLIELKPHQRESIGALLAGIKRVGVVGYERTSTGFVNQTGHTLIHPTALTIGGQTFSL